MRRWLWLGLFFLASSWLFFSGEFVPPDMLIGGALAVIGIVCTVLGAWHSAPSMVPARLLVLLVPVGLAAVVIPLPFSLGAIVVFFGLLGMLFAARRHWAMSVSGGVCLAGGLLLVQAGLLAVYTVWVSHGHRVDLLSPLFSTAANVLGLSTTSLDGVIYLQVSQQVIPLTVTLEKLGIAFLVTFVGGSLLLFYLFVPRRRLPAVLVIFLLVSGFYLFVRFLAVVAWFQASNQLEVFWDPVLTAISFLPLALLFARFLRLPGGDSGSKLQIRMPRAVPRLIMSAAFAVLCISCLLLASLYAMPGTPKQGRILIDEAHSDWEDSIQPLNRTWYGTLSTYNYYSWATWLDDYYIVMKNENSSLTPSLLDNVDILVLKCPTSAYIDDERTAIKDFVADGGGLFLIGDHTDVFGMNTFLNPVAEQFGLRFNTDATYDLQTGNLTTITSAPYTRHPVMARVPTFHYMTSCSIEPTSLLSSLQIENIMTGRQLSIEPGTYATENFFSETTISAQSSYGSILQSCAIRYGAGRIIAFTDSTVFSSFSVFTDGYTDFSLGVFSYLNQQNSLSWLPPVLVLVALGAGVCAIYLIYKEEKVMVVAVLGAAALLAVAVMLPALASLNAMAAMPAPSQHGSRTVGFDREHSAASFDVMTTLKGNEDWGNYGTFFVWTQRVGAIPELHARLVDALASDIAVLINPSRPFSDADQTALTDFLARGGRLLVLDTINNPTSTANEILQPLGISIYPALINTSNMPGNGTINGSTQIIPILAIEGGDALCVDDNGQINIAGLTFENTTRWPGKILVMVDALQFSSAAMGSPFTEPNSRQHQIYETEFFLFDTLFS